VVGLAAPMRQLRARVGQAGRLEGGIAWEQFSAATGAWVRVKRVWGSLYQAGLGGRAGFWGASATRVHWAGREEAVTQPDTPA